MSVITFPEGLDVTRMTWEQQRNDLEHRSPFGAQAQEVGAPQWAVSIEAPDMREADSGAWKALIMQLKGRTNQLALWDIARPAPIGTLRGSGVPFSLAANVAIGATSMQLTAGTSNLLTFPEAFDNAAWLRSRATLNANVIAGPDGTVTADKLVEDTATGVHETYRTGVITIGTVMTASVFFKSAERTFGVIRGTNIAANGGGSVVFNLSNGTIQSNGVTLGTASIISLGNGWYWCIVTFTGTAVANQSLAIGIANDAAASSYTGDGVSGLYIWGAKLEAASTATDYGYGKTLLKGDLLGIGSGLTQQVVMLTEDATSTGQGNITVNFEHPLRNAFTAGAEVRWDKPKALFRRQNSRAGWDYVSAFANGFGINLLEDWRP